MAFMNQEKKKLIAERIKAEFPNWSVRLKVSHHSSIRVQIVRADVDLMGAAEAHYNKNLSSNPMNRQRKFEDGNEIYGKMETYFGKETEATEQMKKFMDCVNLVGHPTQANYDHSEPMSDFCCVGYFTYVHVGGNTDTTQFKYVPKKSKAKTK